MEGYKGYKYQAQPQYEDDVTLINPKSEEEEQEEDPRLQKNQEVMARMTDQLKTVIKIIN